MTAAQGGEPEGIRCVHGYLYGQDCCLPPRRDDEATVERMRPFPMQDGPPIPWCVAEAIYEHLYREKEQSLERLAQRGGFAWREVDHMWRDLQWGTTNAQREACGQQVRAALAAAQEGMSGDDATVERAARAYLREQRSGASHIEGIRAALTAARGGEDA